MYPTGAECQGSTAADELDNFNTSAVHDQGMVPVRLAHDDAIEFDGNPIGGHPEDLEKSPHAQTGGRAPRLAIYRDFDVVGHCVSPLII